jgi:outer membrane receptor protein involved in Fe transport
MRKKLNLLLCSFLLVLASVTVTAQVTTATLSGIVQDSKGAALASATVTVEFPDAGIKQIIATKADGRFTVPNLRVGGPYKITINHVGHNATIVNNLFLELGQNNPVQISMEEKTTELKEVVIQGGGNRIFDSKRTGASTTINNRLLRSLPTINRSADDYLRLAPSASSTYNGLSFGGRNGQYNNFSLDGAVFNNPFGLDAPTPGGQTGAQPVSLDAIEQIQVNLAPYDVTQAGFTGAGVNTVTKSGTNITTGTVYSFFRNKSMTGQKVNGTKQEISDLSQVQIGAALGGALKKNKLFYFLSFETEQREDAASSYVAQNSGNTGKSNTARVLEQDLKDVSNILRTKFGYETGPYQDFTHKQINYKWLAKLDWNINSNNKLSFTYNGLDAKKDKPAHPSALGRRGPDFTTLQFQNSGYQIVNKLHSFSTELKSNFKESANKLRVVYTSFRDNRNPFSTPFPVVNISKFGSRYIVAGHEPFSINNTLNQDAFQATNDFTFYKKNHTITLGASYESFKFANSFNIVGYGFNMFLGDIDINTFKSQVPTSGNIYGFTNLDLFVNYSKGRAATNRWNLYKITVAQLSAYAQDEWQVSDRLKFTVGLRIDKPAYTNPYFESPVVAGEFDPNPGSFQGTYNNGTPTLLNNNNLVLFDANGNPIKNGQGKDLDNLRLPTTKPLFSPRFGFNWNAIGDRQLQVRGGTGLFTGRFPFVWLGNHIGNPDDGFYCVTDRNFKWPQVWRTNIGFDVKTKGGTVITTDIAYTKDVNAMMVRNYRFGKPTGTLNSGTGDKRKIYTAADQGTVNAYVFTNVKEGYQFNASIQAMHNFKNGLYLMGAYNYLVAKDASSVSAEISGDAFDRNPILNNVNEARLTPSLYGNTHRFIVAASRKFEYGTKGSATTVSFFSSWTSGNRFGYVYGADINNDGSSFNDLMYVPTDAEIGTMNFAPFTDVNGNVQSAATQRTAFQNFINQDKYLSSLKGQYTEKYGAVTPWRSQFDLRILQDVPLSKIAGGKKLQLSLDIINLGNMISSKWGVQEYASATGYYQPVNVSVAGSTPTFQFDPSQTKTFVPNPDLLSRWQMQFGVRYIF